MSTIILIWLLKMLYLWFVEPKFNHAWPKHLHYRFIIIFVQTFYPQTLTWHPTFLQTVSTHQKSKYLLTTLVMVSRTYLHIVRAYVAITLWNNVKKHINYIKWQTLDFVEYILSTCVSSFLSVFVHVLILPFSFHISKDTFKTKLYPLDI